MSSCKHGWCISPVALLATPGLCLQQHLSTPRAGVGQSITPALNVQGWARLCQGTRAAASPAWAIQEISSSDTHCWSLTMGLYMYWPAAASAAQIPQPGTTKQVQHVQSRVYIQALDWTKTHTSIVNVVSFTACVTWSHVLQAIPFTDLL